jgi:hypothetical protein
MTYSWSLTRSKQDWGCLLFVLCVNAKLILFILLQLQLLELRTTNYELERKCKKLERGIFFFVCHLFACFEWVLQLILCPLILCPCMRITYAKMHGIFGYICTFSLFSEVQDSAAHIESLDKELTKSNKVRLDIRTRLVHWYSYWYLFNLSLVFLHENFIFVRGNLCLLQSIGYLVLVTLQAISKSKKAKVSTCIAL